MAAVVSASAGVDGKSAPVREQKLWFHNVKQKQKNSRRSTAAMTVILAEWPNATFLDFKKFFYLL